MDAAEERQSQLAETMVKEHPLEKEWLVAFEEMRQTILIYQQLLTQV